MDPYAEGVPIGRRSPLRRSPSSTPIHIVELVAPRVGGITTAKGEHVPAQQQVEGGPSVLYAAVAVMVSTDGAETLATSHAAKTFVADAFAHLKFIAHNDAAQPLFEAAGVTADAGVMLVAGKRDARAYIDACAELRHWARGEA